MYITSLGKYSDGFGSNSAEGNARQRMYSGNRAADTIGPNAGNLERKSFEANSDRMRSNALAQRVSNESTELESRLKNGLGAQQEDPSRTFAQEYWGNDRSNLFNRNMQYNPANDIAAGNAQQPYDYYQNLINKYGQPTSLGSEFTPTNTYGADNVIRDGSSFSDSFGYK